MNATRESSPAGPSARTLTASRLDLSGAEPVPVEEIEARVMRGEVIVVRGCLQAIGWVDRLEEASLTGIRNAVGEGTALGVAKKGLHLLHEVIDPDDLDPIMRSLYDHYRSITPALARAVLHEALGIRKAFYYEDTVNVRFHVPHDFAARNGNRQKLAKDWSGKVTPHCPHHDSWYECPVNAFNIWIAVGPVRHGNGMTLFPEIFGKRLPCTKDGQMVPGHYFGAPMSFDLEPGDALIFHGEHLHSSEINITDETRHVVSVRVTLDRPKFLEPSTARFVHALPPGNPWHKLAAALRHGTAAARSWLRGRRPDQPGPPYADTSARFPKMFPQGSVPEAADQAPAFDDSTLAVGEIRPISRTRCAARLGPDHVVVFQRQCPHEGADLAGGYLRNGSVVCPWHNLPIDLGTGASPCAALRRIKVAHHAPEAVLPFS